MRIIKIPPLEKLIQKILTTFGARLSKNNTIKFMTVGKQHHTTPFLGSQMIVIMRRRWLKPKYSNVRNARCGKLTILVAAYSPMLF